MKTFKCGKPLNNYTGVYIDYRLKNFSVIFS
ncbi:hypothetical protein T03_3100 [Trichinella britovi]|uniref:Uncharacterized protein n=1 Tax=Trichinella britovi TaxID=45882 RepID=A0A0V0YZ29_TRIBR|nr:hypothetical protein T06_6243 [Trichinella sp. T6]KRY05405.1 hypothetical protein T03_3100 [Trichinella britovi]